jgi:hypothetical protein
MLKPGNLVYFSSKYLPYDFEKLRQYYGLLLEYVDLPGRGDITYPGWKTLWGETKLTVLESDISLLESKEP